jgi:hypothetical protein
MTTKSSKELSAQDSTSLVKKLRLNTSKFSGLKQTKQFVSVLLVLQVILIGVRGNLDVFSGKSPLDVIPSMLAQGIELILKAQRAEKSLKESKSKQQSTYPAN